MKIAISLVWIRHKVAGGVESFTRNILDGLKNDSSKNIYVLLCSIDNIDSFRHYEQDSRFSVYECPVHTASLKETLFFESFKLDDLVSEMKADLCFIPSFRMPLLGKKNKYVVVVHDLISSNMPELFTWYRRNWLNYATKRAWRSADSLVTISNFVAEDLTNRFGARDRRYTVYNPILPDRDTTDFAEIQAKYDIKENHYFYTVSSLAKNKNLITLLKTMDLIKDDVFFNDYKLLISGVGLSKEARSRFDADYFFDFLEEKGLKERCVFTGFVSNEERNTLIANSKCFLFPSVFEGFGMPVVEAMELGANVITTKCASIPEVSHNLANYVDDPYDEKEWCKMIKNHVNDSVETIHFSEYELSNITSQYLKIFEEVVNL